MPLILGTNSIKETSYDVANSCRFNDGSSDHLVWNSSPAGNRQKFTFSIWFKRATLGNTQVLASASYSSGDEGYLYISSGDTLEWDSTNSGDGDMFSSIKLRDTSSWYHLVWAVDTTQSTAGNRMKFYLNGTQMTTWSTETQPNLNQQIYWNVGGTYYPYIGRRHGGDYFDGYMAEIVQIDDQQLDASSFGEFDSDTPTVWKPKDLEDLTFGGNTSYYLDFEDSSSLGNDVSGNNHDFTAQNLTSIDQSTDTCTNNFATLNSLDMNESTGRTFSEGNLTYTSDSSNASSARGTFGVNSGKWYYEVKIVSQSGSASSNGKFGTFGFTDIAEYSDPATNGLTIISDGRLRGQGSTGSVVGSPPLWGVGDILMFALDLDNQNLYMGKNGSWRTSAGAFSHSSPTDTIYTSIDTSKFWTPFGQKNVSANNTLSYSMNFGSPAFSISSGNADGEGFGNFEYAVPSNYFSLNTKNLAEYG